MKLIYHGPHDAVEIPLPDGQLLYCERGEEIDVPADLGARLLEQPSNWRRARLEARSKTDAKKPREIAGE